MICYVPALTTPEKLGNKITALGYKIETVAQRSPTVDAKSEMKRKALLPDDAPKFLRDAFALARENGRPLIVDFWATWCGPCVQLKNVTFSDDTVKPLLEQCQVIYVDLDEYPKLAEFYGVAAVPDVFLINRDGVVVDRFQNFEPPAAFAKRLRNLVKEGRHGN